VSLVDPTSPWSFLNYLRARDRLFAFYLYERFHVPRREYDDYCRWAAEGLESCRFGARVDALEWDAGAGAFRVRVAAAGNGRRWSATARNVVLGVGTEPVVPDALQPALGERVFHAAEYLARQPAMAGARDVTVVGSGQSGAEVVLDLLRAQPEAGWRVRWLTRSPAFAPMEYSKLGLEHFTPGYTRYFHGLAPDVRDRLVPSQWQLYKGISADTISDVFDLLYERSVGGARPDAELMPRVAVEGAEPDGDGIALRCRELHQDRPFTVWTDRLVLATGYAARRPACLDGMSELVDWDAEGRYRVDAAYRVATDPVVTGGLYVQNAELHTHGVGAPDLGLGAWRAAVILNAVAGRTVHRLPEATAFTTFGLA
jgi:lysine N6-hydroxylase